MASWMREHRGSQSGDHYRNRERYWRYGLTPEAFAAMLEAQGGGCAICKTPDPGPAGWNVDHDHACCPRDKRSCGKCVCGILCCHCNKGIGELKDDPAIIMAARDYVILTRNRSTVAPLDS